MGLRARRGLSIAASAAVNRIAGRLLLGVYRTETIGNDAYLAGELGWTERGAALAADFGHQRHGWLKSPGGGASCHDDRLPRRAAIAWSAAATPVR
jgi:hypothetical protein